MNKRVNRSRIDRRWTPDAVTVAGYTLRPVLRVSGQAVRPTVEGGAAGGVGVRIDPLGVNVQAPDGHTTYVDTPDATAAALRQMLLVGLIITAVTWTVLLVRRLRS